MDAVDNRLSALGIRFGKVTTQRLVDLTRHLSEEFAPLPERIIFRKILVPDQAQFTDRHVAIVAEIICGTDIDILYPLVDLFHDEIFRGKLRCPTPSFRTREKDRK